MTEIKMYRIYDLQYYKLIDLELPQNNIRFLKLTHDEYSINLWCALDSSEKRVKKQIQIACDNVICENEGIILPYFDSIEIDDTVYHIFI